MTDNVIHCESSARHHYTILYYIYILYTIEIGHMHFSSVVFGTVLLQTASNFGWIWRGTACCTCDDTNVGEVRFAVQLGKTLELVFLVKWVRYQGARGFGMFGWARWRRHRCSTSAVIWTASPKCSYRASPYFMVFPCFSHQGKGKTWYMDSVQSTGWLQVKSA